MVEQLYRKQQVGGSNPLFGSEMLSRRLRVRERRLTRKAYLLLLASAILFGAFILFVPSRIAQILTFTEGFKSDSLPQEQDKTPPAPPGIEPPPDYIKTDKITITGRAEIDSVVKIYNNETPAGEITVDQASNFSTEITLTEGKNEIWATATDSAGNTSDKSSTRAILYDTKAPQMEIKNPQDGQSFSGKEEKSITIEGTINETEVKVTINDRLANLTEDGRFLLRYTLAEGENTLIFVAVDKAENKTEKTVTVTYSP